MAEKHNFQIDQGTDWVAYLRYKDSSDNLFDLSLWSARMDIRTAPDAPDGGGDPILELTTANGRIELGDGSDPDKNITLRLTNALTSAVVADTYFYDLELVTDGGVVTRKLEGKVKFRQEVTR